MKIKNIIRYVLIAVFSVTFIISSVMLVKTLYDGKKAEDDFDDLAQLVEADDTASAESSAVTSGSSQSSKPKPSAPAITRNIAKLKELNSECVGWISIPGTKVNYPVMYTPSDPEKYLKRNFYGQKSGAGVPFIDARCNLETDNLIIYGHNMKNRSMFGSLRNYLKEDYLKKHPIIEFETIDGCSYYEIIEVRKTDIKDPWYQKSFNYSENGEKYLALSTCRGTVKTDRLLIIAVKKAPEKPKEEPNVSDSSPTVSSSEESQSTTVTDTSQQEVTSSLNEGSAPSTSSDNQNADS